MVRVRLLRHFACLLVGAVSVLILGCNTSSLMQTTGQERFFIEKSELPAIKKRALIGDKAALHRILNYYLFAAPHDPEARKWIRLAERRGVYRRL